MDSRARISRNSTPGCCMLRRLWLWLRGETPRAIFSFEAYGSNGDWCRCTVCKRVVAIGAQLAHARREHSFSGEHIRIG